MPDSGGNMNEMGQEEPAQAPRNLEEENLRLRQMLTKALADLETMTKKNIALMQEEIAESRKIDETLGLYRSTLEETEMRMEMLVQQRDDAIAEVVRLRALLREDDQD